MFYNLPPVYPIIETKLIPSKPNGISDSYQLDQFIFKGRWVLFINFISILREHCASILWRFCSAASDLGIAWLPLTHKKSSAASGLGLHG